MLTATKLGWYSRHHQPSSNDANSNSPAKEITFDSDSTATIKSECLSVKILCDSNVALQDKQLTKVY